MSEIEKRLQDETFSGDWEMLRPHAINDALILVANDVDLITAGSKVVMDDVVAVEEWLRSSKLRKPTADEIAQWDNEPSSNFFEFVIVQPFVIAQVRLH